MTLSYKKIGMLLSFLMTVVLHSCEPSVPKNWKWETLTTKGKLDARHEAGLVAFNKNLYLMGGRRINPTSAYNTETNTWVAKSKPPIEIHHFQPVVLGDAIYIIGALTGQWPREKPIDKVIIYYPKEDKYVFSHDIPKERQRGSAGLAVYNNKIYVVGGITNGHMNGFKPWFDEYDPATGKWTVLPDANFARDHFQAVVNDHKLYAFGGRTSSRATKQDMSLTITHGDIFDFKEKQWLATTSNLAIPTERAGNFAFSHNNQIIIGGGESETQEKAHSEIEAFDTTIGLWGSWPNLNEGRHGSGFAVVGNFVYTASGCGKGGGEPELYSLERLELPKGKPAPISSKKDTTPIYKQWHTITLSFNGEATDETAEENPFLNYKLQVEFQHKNTKKVIRGFYAADGNAAETSATSGTVWQVRFTPEVQGDWTYKASLKRGTDIAINNTVEGTEIPLENAAGKFRVTASDKEITDFSKNGFLEAYEGYFRYKNSEKYWIKAGANSPENLLAYIDFDGTERIRAKSRDEEAQPTDTIHQYKPHIKDWKFGDPTWKNGKGKALIGAVNYLASKGMNAVYFLTLNILGDGKDVWPYVTPNDFTRFDVSKLEQWEIVFNHMQAKGIMLHVVLQETENETLLDNGDTGKLRKLYFNELIARFGHHLALVWNLGEENGPTPWSPEGQNDAQRKEMIRYLKNNDPYQHPVLLHTQAEDPLRSDILNDIVGFKELDGLSFQQGDRKQTAAMIETWKKKSVAANNNWLITMDEIGKWHTGALMDEEDPDHKTLTHYVLWGSLLSGSAGVEWYFGGKHPHNDLTSEDWRKRDRLWKITNHAKTFFNTHIPYWKMQPAHTIVKSEEGYCLREKNKIYALYFPKTKNYIVDLSETTGTFSVQWYNPFKGGSLQSGSVSNITAGNSLINLGNPPPANQDQDWVVLISKIN